MSAHSAVLEFVSKYLDGSVPSVPTVLAVAAAGAWDCKSFGQSG